MRKLLMAGVAVMALLAGRSANAQALCTTSDGPCSSLADQLLQYTEQGLQLDQETITAVREYENTLPLATNSFEDLTNDINNILGLVNTANMLVGLTGQIVQNINALGGYPLGNISNWHQQFTNEANAVGKAFMVCGQVTNILQGIGNDARLLTNFVNQVMAVIGRQQSLQNVSGQLSQLGQEIQKIESGKMGCRQGFATYYAAKQDHQYLTQTVGDHDLELSWLAQCQAVANLGGTLSIACAGSQ
jgi:hypothetical protein